MQVTALASGSSGNAYLLRSGPTAVLIEAGLPGRRLADFLMAEKLDPRLLSGIFLTHAHGDHARGARFLSEKYGVPIYATAGTLSQRRLRRATRGRVVQPGRSARIGELEVLPFRVPHDCAEPVGFRLTAQSGTVCLTTDLGFVPVDVSRVLEGADLLVVAANHDEEMLWSGPYPSFLKHRVGGANGHLSNPAAAACIARMQRQPPGEVWLAHLSLVNNRPAKALTTVQLALNQVDLGHISVAAAGRNRPSLRWRSEPLPAQFSLL